MNDLLPPRRNTKVFAINNDSHIIGFEYFHQLMGNLIGETFLNLRTLCVVLYDPVQFR